MTNRLGLNFSRGSVNSDVNSKNNKELAKSITGDLNENIIENDDFEVTVKPVKPDVKVKNTTLLLDKDVYDNIELMAKRAHTSVNAVISEFINKYYDEETDDFKIDIPVAKKKVTKSTPIQVREDALAALNRNAKDRNLKAGEYFGEMFNKKVK